MKLVYENRDLFLGELSPRNKSRAFPSQSVGRLCRLAKQRGLCERKCPELKGSMRASPLLHSRGVGFQRRLFCMSIHTKNAPYKERLLRAKELAFAPFGDAVKQCGLARQSVAEVPSVETKDLSACTVEGGGFPQ